MTARNLGTLERVPVREVWPNEALNFTPWLEENLSLLSEAIGMELELVQMEATLPGGTRVDILAKQVESGAKVVIENQLDVSDDDHCARLLGYAAHSDSSILIWVAGEFKDWHCRIVDWLNEKGVEIYGVEVSAWRIGDSYAPALNLVAGRTISEPQEMSGDRQPGQVYRDFFQPLIDDWRNKGLTDRLTALASNDHWFESGYEYITYHAGFWGGNRDPRLDLYLWIATEDKDRNKEIFDALLRYREEIESELAGVWWSRRDNQRMSAIYTSIISSINEPEERLAEVREWAIDTLPKFKAAIQPRLVKVISELGNDE